MAFLLTASLLMMLAQPRAAAAIGDMDALCAQLTEAARSSAAVSTGVALIDLQSGAECAVDGDRPFRSASLYKTVVAAELYRQIRAGLVTLDEPLTITPADAIDDPANLRITSSYTITVGDALSRMITFSDNGSAFALRRRLEASNVDAATEWLGLPSTTLTNVFLTTPNDQAHLFRSLYDGTVVDTESSRALISLLLQQQVADMIPQGLPAGTRVAHKTGTLDTFLHDAAVVYAPGGDFVLVVMTENTDFESALQVIHDVAEVAYDAYAVVGPLLTSEAALANAAAPADIPAAQLAPVADTAQAPVVQESGGSTTLILDGASVEEGIWSPALLASILALVAGVAMVPVMLRRRATVRYGAETLAPAGVRLRADRSERGVVMRFGSRREDDGRPATMSPASRSVAEVPEVPVLPSRRLQRVAEHFRSQGELLSSMRDEFEQEMEPLHELIVKQSQSMQALLQNLEERLRPLNEYADGEEANLSALEGRIQEGGQDHVARSFSVYLEEQRRRISETRDQIDKQRVPFVEYGDAQRDTVETALARFDNDIQALEENLSEQRRVMMRMLDAMRSETFAAVKQYLEGRQQALQEMAARGTTDPNEIGRALQTLRRGLEEVASKSDYVRALLQQAEAADRALIDTAPQPRPLRQDARQETRALETDDAVEDVEEAEVSA